MRDIKFRAWWVKENVMLHNVQDFYDTLGQEEHGNTEEPECSFGDILGEPKEYIVMQYTGIKDKNGKEIYEGDVIKGLYDGTLDYSNKLAQVKFHLGCFVDDYFSSCLNNSFIGSFGRGNTLEVIGNIYENPELLKGVNRGEN